MKNKTQGFLLLVIIETAANVAREARQKVQLID